MRLRADAFAVKRRAPITDGIGATLIIEYRRHFGPRGAASSADAT